MPYAMSSSNFELIMNFESTSNLTLVLATVWVATKVFPPRTRGPTHIGQYADTKMAHMVHNDLIEAFLLPVTKTPTTRALLEADNNYDGYKKEIYDFYSHLNDEEYLYRLNANKRKAIWFIDGLNSFGRLEVDLMKERNHFNRNGYFVIVYTGRETNRSEILHNIFQRLFAIYVVNVNIFVASEPTVYVYTYFPFTRTKCHDFQPSYHGIIGPNSNYKYSRKEFFPKKIFNMWGCNLNVTTWTETPFIKLEYNKMTGKIMTLEGIEGKLIRLLAKHMNFSIQIVEDPNRQGGNGIDPGAIKMLRDGLTNISIVGLMYDNLRQKFAQPGYSYLNAPLNLGIPLGKMMTPLERLTRPFTFIVWSWLSLSLLLGVILIYVLKISCNRRIQELVFGQGNRLPFTNLWNVFYGGPIAGTLPRRSFARYLLGLWIFYTLIIRSAYLAQLFFILQDSHFRSEFSTVSEVLKQNFTFYSYPITVPVLLDSASRQLRIEIIKADPNALFKIFGRLGEDENANIAVAAFGFPMRVYNQNPENQMRRVNILREPLIHAPITLYMRKHSYLIDNVNDILLNIVSAGIINRFEKISLPEGVHTHKNTQAPESIPLYSLIGLFFVYVFLLMLSSLVFLLELWSKHSPLTRRFLKVLNL